MTDLTYCIDPAAAAFRGGAERPEGLPSAPSYDAALITWHALYHTGQQPRAISCGRGHSYNVTLHVTIVDYADHRFGVVGIIDPSRHGILLGSQPETVKALDIFGVVHDTHATEAELNGWHAQQGALL